ARSCAPAPTAGRSSPGTRSTPPTGWRTARESACWAWTASRWRACRLPAVPVGDGVERDPLGRREPVAGVVRDRRQPGLRVLVVGDAEDVRDLALVRQVQGGVGGAQAPSAGGQEEAPERRDDRAPQAALLDRAGAGGEPAPDARDH